MKITIKNFQKKIPINPTRIKKTILRVLSSEGPQRSCEINVCFVNQSKIKELNRIYLGLANSTDVIAFDLSLAKKPIRLLADIIICAPQAEKNAKIYKTSIAYELSLYAVHGLLHILGYDDRTKKQIRLIRQKERKYVNS